MRIQMPGVGVAAVVVPRYSRSVLVITRGAKHGAGTISVPGGWMEWGEDPGAAAVREVLEETGIEASVIHPLHPIFDVTNDVMLDDPYFPVHCVTLWVALRTSTDLAPTETEPEKCIAPHWAQELTLNTMPKDRLFHPLRTILERGHLLKGHDL